MIRRRIGWVICALLLSACAGRPLPQATPTVAPTRTPTPTPPTQVALNPTRTPLPTLTHTQAVTLTATAQPTDSPTPAPTNTPTQTVQPTNTSLPRFEPTNTPTLTPTTTSTPTPTITPSLSPTPTATFTPEPTATHTPTETLTATLTPSLSATPRPTATASQTASPQPSATLTIAPSATATQGPTSTATIDPFFTTEAPTWTPIPSPTDTLTVTPTVPQIAPTLDVTPIFATLAPDQPTPDGGLASQTPVQGDATQISPATSTPTAAPTVANVNPPPTLSLAAVLIPPPSSVGVPRAFALGENGLGNAFTLPTQSELSLFIRNPRDPNQYLTTDVLGIYSLVINGQRQGLPAPFTDFYPDSRAANDKLVTDAAWSPDGRFVAFVVDNPDQKQGSDGVWWYEPGASAPTQVMVNCRPGAGGCGMVQPVGAPYNWYAASVVWSPDNQRILARTFMYANDFDGQMGALILERGTDRSIRGHLIPYEYTDWTGDGQRLVVSGRDSMGRYVFGTVGLDGQDYRPAAAAGQLWVQNAVQTSNGLIGLGRSGDMNGAMRLVNQAGSFLTTDIGTTRPVEVKWNPQRTSAFIRTEDGRAFLASVTGQVEDISGRIGDIQAVAWVQGELPPILSAPSTSEESGETYTGGLPSGVIEGSLYAPGQQLIIQSTTGGLNLRAEPSTTAGVVTYVFNGEYVAILAGPVTTESDGRRYTWWRVQIANGSQGWMAAAIDGTPTFISP